jgi:protein PhnA
MSEEMKACPVCESPYGYTSGLDSYTCPECANEWSPKKLELEEELKILDSNGTRLQTGDSVIVIKNLPVKGVPKPVKSGTKVKNIRLTEGEHNINCKIDGFGSLQLKSEFVRKSN